MLGRYDEILDGATKAALDKLSEEDRHAIAWANVMSANRTSDRAKTGSDDNAAVLFQKACEKYAEAIRIKPDKHEAFYNWGNALSDQAMTKSGDEADALEREALEKFAEAARLRSV